MQDRERKSDVNKIVSVMKTRLKKSQLQIVYKKSSYAVIQATYV